MTRGGRYKVKKTPKEKIICPLCHMKIPPKTDEKSRHLVEKKGKHYRVLCPEQKFGT